MKECLPERRGMGRWMKWVKGSKGCRPQVSHGDIISYIRNMVHNILIALCRDRLLLELLW